MDYSDSVDIATDPAKVFSVIADLPNMGRLSPENTGGSWINSPGPRVGAKFRGTNRHGDDTWATVATVTTYDPPNCFVFEVTYKIFRISRWEFCVEETPTGCRVIEKWRDRRNWLVRRQSASDEYDRATFTKESIRSTLAALKAQCEQDE